MAFPAQSRSMLGEHPRIPHLSRRRSEIGDLRDDVDSSFGRIEAEIDSLSDAASDITVIHTAAIVAAQANETVRVNPVSNPQTVNLPVISAANAGRFIEVKEVGGSVSGDVLANSVTLTPAGTNTVDGQAAFQILTQRGAVVLRSDGDSDWMVTSVYLPAVSAPAVADHHQTDQFTSTALQTVFTLSRPPADSADVVMHVNGQRQQNGVDFTVTGTTITWLDAQFTLAGGDAVQLDYDF